MASQGDGLIRKTQRGLSILAFETTKQSRILKKRMRIAALQKEVKADLRDLGNLVYNAVINEQPGILEEEEVKILVDNVRENKEEVEHLRDAISRLSRVKKHFEEEEEEYEAPEPAADEPAAVDVQPGRPEPRKDYAAEVDAGKDEEAAVLEPVLEETPEKPTPKSKPKAAAQKAEKEPAVPPAPGADVKLSGTEDKPAPPEEPTEGGGDEKEGESEEKK